MSCIQKSKIKIEARDFAGAIFANIEISVHENKYLTDENGICVIPITKQFRISYANQEFTYNIKNENTSEIEILIGNINFTKIRGTFITRKNEICRIGDNPTDLTCFRKLKKARELKLFPSR